MSNKSRKLLKNQRRQIKNYLIEPFKQIRFGLYILALCMVFLCLSWWLFISSFIDQYEHVLEIFNVVDSKLRWEFISNDIFYTNMIRLFIFFTSFIAIFFATILKLTHRFYGLLVSIDRFLDQLISGNYSARVSIRKKDELQKLVKKLNQLAEAIEKRKNHNDID